MSACSINRTFVPLSLRDFAYPREPHKPCSSPEKKASTTVRLKRTLKALNSLPSERRAEVPDASSSPPVLSGKLDTCARECVCRLTWRLDVTECAAAVVVSTHDDQFIWMLGTLERAESHMSIQPCCRCLHRSLPNHIRVEAVIMLVETAFCASVPFHRICIEMGKLSEEIS